MRGADGGPWNRICALPALWVGLLYDQGALDAAWDLVKGWSIEDQQALRDAVPKEGLCAPAPGGGTVGDLVTRLLDIAAAGLAARGEVNSMGDNAAGFLEPPRSIPNRAPAPEPALHDRYPDTRAAAKRVL